jgi:hypothetical protein
MTENTTTTQAVTEHIAFDMEAAIASLNLPADKSPMLARIMFELTKSSMLQGVELATSSMLFGIEGAIGHATKDINDEDEKTYVSDIMGMARNVASDMITGTKKQLLEETFVVE